MKPFNIAYGAACIFEGVVVSYCFERSNTKIMVGGFARAIGLIRGPIRVGAWVLQQVGTWMPSPHLSVRTVQAEPLPTTGSVTLRLAKPGQGRP